MLLQGCWVFKDSRLIIIADWTQCDGHRISARLIGWSARPSLQLAKKIPEETEHTEKTVAMPSRCNSPPEVFVVEQATPVQTHPSNWIRFIWKVKHVRVLNIWKYCNIVAAVRLKWWTNAVNRWIKCGDWPLNYGNGVCQESTCAKHRCVSAYVHEVIEIRLSCVNAGYVSECFSVVPKWNVLKAFKNARSLLPVAKQTTEFYSKCKWQ